ncbi:MAG: S-methyl-5'-thioadenosine phosphorylase [Myxococcaceae bacterium]
MSTVTVGIIGGSGLGQALGALGGERVKVETPFGPPSADPWVTEVSGVRCVLLPRHGEGHRFPPSQVPYRANIWALKKLGVTRVLASAAVGSLREAIAPRELVICDQVIDKTFRRTNTFFDDVVVHTEMAAPFCPSLRKTLLDVGYKKTRVHDKGAYVCVEGPQFSTRAESELHRAWGADVVGMTVMPEARLAREAELCYALIALPTDYDCWRPPVAEVSHQELLQEILGNLDAARGHALELIRNVLPEISQLAASVCGCQHALGKGAIWTDPARIPAETRQRLALLLDKHLPR